MPAIDDIVDLIAREDTPVMIHVRKNIDRVIAEIFPHKDGIVFADLGFCDPLNSGHPFHLVEGELTAVGKNKWKVGKATIRVPAPDESFYQEWVNWMVAKKNFVCTRELARKGIEADFGFGN